MKHRNRVFSLLNPGWFPLYLSGFSLIFYFVYFDFYQGLVLAEDGIVEWLTSISALVAGVVAIVIGRSFYHQKKFRELGVLSLFALGCFFFGGEEISWGQRLFDVDVEEVAPLIYEHNRQEELNLHNIKAFAKVRLMSDVFCVVWGVLMPWLYRNKPMPILWLQPFLTPTVLVPGFLTTLLITYPGKVLEFMYGQPPWLRSMRFGELKEFCFALMLLLFITHVYQYCKAKQPLTEPLPHEPLPHKTPPVKESA